MFALKPQCLQQGCMETEESFRGVSITIDLRGYNFCAILALNLRQSDNMICFAFYEAMLFKNFEHNT